jgi:hypothetical protein
MQQRAIGMTINHREIDHLLQQMADVIRNAAYKVCGEKYPVGHERRSEWFDETGTLLAMDDTSVKDLLKDAIDHYLMFHAVARSGNQSDFNYYLNDNFQMIVEHVEANPHIGSYLSASFASACGILASTLAPVIEDLSSSGHGVDRVESFTLNTEESYYLVVGEDQETYDPKDDDLSTVDTYQSPEELAAQAARFKARQAMSTAAAPGLPIQISIQDYSSVLALPIEPLPRHPHINGDQYHALTANIVIPELGLTA